MYLCTGAKFDTQRLALDGIPAKQGRVVKHLAHNTKIKDSPRIIKLISVVIECYSIVIPSFCVIKLYYLGNYHGIAANYRGIVF